MIITPKIRGFICTTTHPTGCAFNVKEQIAYTQKSSEFGDKPKNVLVIGASSGYGLSSRIAAAFGAQASTIGVFFEKPGTEKKTGTAGWYNAAAFDREAKAAGLYAKSFNGDAFSDQAKQKVIDTIKADLGEIDLVIYSLASPVRKLPQTGEVIRSALKPIGKPYVTTAVDTNKDMIIEATIEPATEQEINDTVTVMGGEDWELWMDALIDADLLSTRCKTVAYSYIGTEITWPIYWHGTLGKAKEDLDRAATAIRSKLTYLDGQANVAVLKSVVTQASSAIPVMPLYLSMVFKKMKEENVHEGCMEQVLRLFNERLYRSDRWPADLDNANRYRVDDWELRSDIQNYCRDLWSQVTTENIRELTDYQYYKDEFLRLFGFEVAGVDYTQEVDPIAHFDVIEIE